MLSDPLSVTYDGVVKSLARTTTSKETTVYRTATGDVEFSIQHSLTEDGLVRVVAILTRNTPDPTLDPFSGGPSEVPNRCGLVFELNPNKFYSSLEIPLLRTSLLNLVDSALQSRLIQNEM